jgi:hypothetical protein
MLQLLVSMSFKNIFITGGLSIIFGVYSLYSLINYLNTTKENQTKELMLLKGLIVKTNKKYNELEHKYLQIISVIEKTTNEIISLNQKIILLEGRLETHVSNIVIEEGEGEGISDDIVSETSYYKMEPNICNDLCEFNKRFPKLHFESESDSDNVSENIKIEPVRIDHNYVSSKYEDNDDNNDNNNHNLNIDTSKDNISWSGITKKMFFG